MASSENQAPTENEENEEPVISMVDYLKEEEELENDAEAVLGDSDENNCTYPLGYKNRQAIYACATCTPADKSPACICLACSYVCHEGHDLVELYTKRNFCCDCGNSKFAEKCKLTPDKREINAENQYNQNFKGVYCTCARPYPDPDDEVEDEMIQCIICEDWYHGRHLGDSKPPDSNFAEMICTGCMEKHPFLWAYTVVTESTQKLQSECSKTTVEVGSEIDTNKAEQSDVKQDQTDEKQDATKSESVTSDEPKSDCLLEDLKKRDVQSRNSATYWPDGLRTKLCVCSKCEKMYADKKIEFLTDPTDTVTAYEQRGKEKRVPEADKEKKVLEGMNRVQQIEMIQGFNDMKSALSEYLKHFAENGKVVRSEDIQEFFQQMQARKRQKTDFTPGHFCR